MKAAYREKNYGKYVETLARYSTERYTADELRLRLKHYALNYEKLLPADKTSRILELGCGPGFFLQYLAEKHYVNYIGVDGAEQQIHRASSLGIENIIQSDIFTFMHEASDKFDVICSFHVLEHLFKEEVIELLEGAFDRLNNNGMLIIEVPNAGSPLFGAHNRYSEFTHEVGFTSVSLREVLYVSGFRKVQVSPVKSPSPYAKLFFMVANYLLHSRFTKDMLMEGELVGIGYKEA